MSLADVLLGPVTFPAKGLMFVFEKVREEAERELYDPARVRGRLFALQRKLEAGEIDEATYDAREAELLVWLEVLYERERKQAEQQQRAVSASRSKTTVGARPARRRPARRRPARQTGRRG